MKALLKGGPADGRLIDIAPTAQKVQVPVLQNPRAQWYEEDEEPPPPAFGAIIYSRTDTRQDGAVIFSCEKLDTKGKS